MHTIRNMSFITLITLVLVFAWSIPAFSAGTVNVERFGKTIRITGDHDNNGIWIVQNIDNLEVNGFSGTTVQGSPVSLVNAVRIFITMGHGNDGVSIFDVNLPDSHWSVSGNEGRDSLEIIDVSARRLIISGGRDNDFILMGGGEGVVVAKRSFAIGGPGDEDEFFIDSEITGPFDLFGFEFIAFGCFRGDTLVATETGLRPIREIRVGDRVWSWDESSGTKVLRKVSRTYRNRAWGLRTVRVGGETLYTTDAHPYWVEGKGWVEARYLQTGDILRTDDGTRLSVLSNDRVDSQRFYAGYDLTKDREAVASLNQQGTVRLAAFQPSEPLSPNRGSNGVVYNLEVEDTHTFFVGKQKVLVHNK